MNKPLTYGSVCSGMEAASLAWGPLGWKCAFLSEIEKAPSALLAQRYPDVPNFGDMTKFEDWPDVAIDLLAGGTPCQSFSVAGLRKGIADPRGSLMLTYGAIAKRYRPTWLFWENVPGVLSSNGGRDFGAFLGMLAELGYGFAYRVLDAQFFGLAQRRKRVFVVGYLGDWRPPAAVLFERESLRGDSAPRRETGEGVAPTISARTKGGGGLGTDAECDGALIPEIARTLLGKENDSLAEDMDTYIAHSMVPDLARALTAHPARIDGESETFIAHALTGEGFDASEDGTGRGTPLVPIAYNITQSQSNKDYNARPTQRSQAITTDGNRPSARGGDVIAFDTTQITSKTNRSKPQTGEACHPATADGHPPAIAFQTSGNCGAWETGDMVGALDTMTDPNSHIVQTHWAVRRLTPRECERLQGAPDDWTNIAYRGRNTIADGPRYKMIGNSWAVPCVRWIGERIALVRVNLTKSEAA